MNTNEEIKRVFSFPKEENKQERFDDDEIIEYISKEEDRFMVVSQGGMGKSYLARKWSKKLNWNIFKAQEIKQENIDNEIIIDNIDEVPQERMKQIFNWINSKSIKRIILFSREANIKQYENAFTIINFTNEDKKVPRYDIEFKINKISYEGFEKFFEEKKQIDSLKSDFLSILSFKLLTEGLININKYDLLEFIRRFNINNSSKIRIEYFIDKEIFRKEKNDMIYFENKSIPSFFVIRFFKKFLHIKDSYLIKYQNYISQINFNETATIINKLPKAERLEIKWKLLKNNNFFFLFLKEQNELTDVLIYGAKISSKKNIAKIIAKIQITCWKDADFPYKSGPNIDLKKDELWKKIDLILYIDLIIFGISDSLSKKIIILDLMMQFEDVSEEKKKIFYSIEQRSKKIINIKNDAIAETYHPIEYNLGVRKLNEISKDYLMSWYGPVEGTTEFLIKNNFKKAKEIIEYFNYKKPLYIDDEKIDSQFIKEIIKQKDFKFLIGYLEIRRVKENAKYNEEILKKIPDNIFEKIIEMTFHERGQYISRIKISKKFYEEKMKKYDPLFFDNIFYYEKSKESKEIDKKERMQDIYKYLETGQECFIFKYTKNWSSLIAGATLKEISRNELEIINKKINSIIENKFQTNYNWNIPIIIDTLLENEIKDIHPLLLLKRNKKSTITSHQKKQIIEYLNDYKKFEELLKNFHLIHLVAVGAEYLFKEIENEKTNTFFKIIYEVYNKSIEYFYLWNDLCFKYFDDCEYARKIAEKIKWHPKTLENLSMKNTNFCLWYKKNKESKEKNEKLFKNIIQEFCNSDFRILKGYSFLGTYTLNWYDQFFGEPPLSYNPIKETSIFLHKEKLTYFFYERLKKRYKDEINNGLKFLPAFPCFVDWTLSLCFFDNKINFEKEMKWFTEKYKEDETIISQINQILLSKTGKLIMKKGNTQKFKILNFYKYMNDDMTIYELLFLFKNQIQEDIKSAGIDELQKNSSDSLEKRIQKRIRETCESKWMREHGLLTQHESNSYNIKNEKRIDFILTKNNKFIFVELKHSKDTRLTQEEKLSQQLQNYDDSFHLLSKRVLVILLQHNLQTKTKDKIEKIADANSFEVLYIDIRS